jgi:cleavage stimulation factor subunit 3
MELQNDELGKVETIFTKSLMSNLNVDLWSLYLDYVRRVHNLTTDATGQARQTINTAFDFVLKTIGIDFDSGRIWEDYVQFTKSGPGVVGGSTWQDQQKMDTLRKTLQRAVCIPTQATPSLWSQYHQFETGLNKLTVSGTLRFGVQPDVVANVYQPGEKVSCG